MLAGPASRALRRAGACIDEFIPFDFFHARSQLGERELTKAGLSPRWPNSSGRTGSIWRSICASTSSTRDVLKYTGARFLAGFDYLGQFPYLDIALDWDGDRTLAAQAQPHHRRPAGAGERDRPRRRDRIAWLMQPGPAPMPLSDLPDRVRALFAKPVVAIHPGAGNVTKQWPEEHFSALIDLLIEKNDVNILLVGGPDEVEVANAAAGRMRGTRGRWPRWPARRRWPICRACCGIACCTSATTAGRSTSPRRSAFRRSASIPAWSTRWNGDRSARMPWRCGANMTCSPCYLANAEDCPRGAGLPALAGAESGLRDGRHAAEAACDR